MIDKPRRPCYAWGMTETGETVSAVAEIGKILRTERRRQGLTIADLAGLAGVSPRFLGELERGVRDNVAADKLLRLLLLLNLKLRIGRS